METTPEYLISIICPTRNRPHNIKRLIQSVKDTVFNIKNIEFFFYLDDDARNTSIPLITDNDIKINCFVGPRIMLSETSNILSRAVKDGILFLIGDDLIFETKDWDIEIQNEFSKSKSKILLIYGQDGIQNEKLATHFFIHKKWVEVLGYVVPPIFWGDWADNWITKTAEELNCKVYREDLKFTHLHPTIGKASFDLVYAEKYLRDQKTNPQNNFEKFNDIFVSDIRKLKDYINETT